jgi:hypothetical protein
MGRTGLGMLMIGLGVVLLLIYEFVTQGEMDAGPGCGIALAGVALILAGFWVTGGDIALG